MSDKEHRIDRDRTGPADDSRAEETVTCDYCGREFTDRERYREHVDREKRDALRDSPIGEAILGRDRRLRR